MKIAYGYERAEADFADLAIDRLYLDTKGTGRSERENMLAGAALRDGDVIVIRDASDLGHGREVPGIRSILAAKGVTIQEVPLERDPAPRGRPSKFNPTPDQDRQIEALYRSYLQMGHILDRVSDIMGHKVKRHQLVHRYGKRWGQ